MMHSVLAHLKTRPWLLIVALALIVAPIYGQFLGNPTVFDDAGFFDGSIHSQYLEKVFSFQWRWLPYASFEWTRVLLGPDLRWYRLGNLVLHITNSAVLFLFLRRLFQVVLAEQTAIAPAASYKGLAAP